MKHHPLSTALLLAAALLGSGYKEVPPPPKVVLPPPLGPSESLAAIRVPADLEVELVAAEPAVMDPVDIAWGPDGRIWVVEMADYPRGMDGKGKPGGRVRVLESTRRDGRYDKSTLFADGLRSPTTAVPWRDGVLVVAVPHIIYLADTDGDGRADRQETLFSGLAEGNEQHLANGLQWSLDGWLHLGNGNSGGKVTSPTLGRVVELGQRDFRVRPETGEVELVTGQTQAGRNRDDWGNWFGGNNSNPIWHFALEEHYLRRNPHFVPPSPVSIIAATPGAARVYPRSQTLARFNDGFAANHFTSACGTMIYRDDLLGPAYAGNAFVCEPVHNLVHREILQPDGASFRGERAPEDAAGEFLASSDSWSRFVAARAGPDGALYVVDMYRLVIEHPQWIPDAWQRELGDLRKGENQGRIYRIKPRGRTLRPVPDLSRADAAGLVAALESPAGVTRDLAQQVLIRRGNRTVAPRLEKLAVSSPLPAARGQALWTLQGLGTLTADIVSRALADPHPGVRQQALRLSEGFAGKDAALGAAVATRATDTDTRVRQQAAYTLGEWPGPAAGTALAALLRADTDRYVRAAAMSSALPHADTLLEKLSGSGMEFEPLLAEIAAATDNARAIASLLARITSAASATDSRPVFDSLGALLDRLQRNNQTLAQLSTKGGEPMRRALEGTDAVLTRARATAVDPQAASSDRTAAIALLGRGRKGQDDDFYRLAELLSASQPAEVQLAAVRAIGRINRTATPERLLAGWAGYGPAVRTTVLDLVLARPAWAHVLLDRVEADEAFRAQIDPGRRTVLSQHPQSKLANRAAAIFGTGIDAGRQKVVDRYLATLPSLKAEAKRGAAVFTNSCSACHRFGETPGRPVGPDLAAVKDRSAGYLVTHILDPNRAVEDRYQFYTATLQDGRTPAGLVTGETGSSLTLLGLDGTEQTILRGELRSLMSSGRSLMPEGLEAAVDEQAMADLVAFLASSR